MAPKFGSFALLLCFLWSSQALRRKSPGNMSDSNAEDAPGIANGDFEAGMVTNTYKYVTIPSWTCSRASMAIIKSGSSDWGGVKSAGGSYYLGLQSANWISQNVLGHQICGLYELHFSRAKRGDNPGEDTPVLEVWIGGSSMGSFAENANEFEKTTIQYTAMSEDVEVKFVQLKNVDTTVFLDVISIKAAPTPRPTQQPTPRHDPPGIANGDFEAGMVTNTYKYGTIPSWTCSASLAIIKSGTSNWGGVESAGGSYYLGLQGAEWISQNVLGHQICGSYELHFSRAKRGDNPGEDTPVLEVWIGGSSMGSFAENANEFEKTTIQYTAMSEDVEIKFVQLKNVDTTVFLDVISIKAVN